MLFQHPRSLIFVLRTDGHKLNVEAPSQHQDAISAPQGLMLVLRPDGPKYQMLHWICLALEIVERDRIEPIDLS